MSNLAVRPDPWPGLCARLGINTPVAAQLAARSGQQHLGAVGIFQGRPDGHRTDNLTRLAGAILAAGGTLADTQAVCLYWNTKNVPPLDEQKVLDTCQSIEQADRRQHPDRAAARDAQTDPAQLLPLFELIAASAARFAGSHPPVRRWVLADFLPLGIAGGLVSPGGVGKSQFLMQMAYAVATGTPLAGHWPVGEPGAVLMLCAEDDEAELHRRFNRIHQQLGQANSATMNAACRSRLFIRSTTGTDTLMTVKTQNREVVRTSWPGRLLKTLEGLPDLKLVILDPASRFRGGEENSNEDGTRFVEALEYVAQTTGATILVAHHANKASMGQGEAAHQANARGASSLTDGLRWQLSLTTVGEKHKQLDRLEALGAAKYLEVSLVKSNYTAPQDRVYLRRETDGYLQAVVASPPAASSDQHLARLLQLIASTNSPLSAKAVEDHHCGSGKALALPQKAARALIGQARVQGLISGERRHPLSLTAKGRAALTSNNMGTRQAAGGQTAAKPRAARKP